MSFTQTQKKLHMRATSALSSIESLNELIAEAVSQKDKEWLHKRLGNKKIEYAEIMKALTEDYIPIEMQTSNVVSSFEFEMVK